MEEIVNNMFLIFNSNKRKDRRGAEAKCLPVNAMVGRFDFHSRRIHCYRKKTENEVFLHQLL